MRKQEEWEFYIPALIIRLGFDQPGLARPESLHSVNGNSQLDFEYLFLAQQHQSRSPTNQSIAYQTLATHECVSKNTFLTHFKEEEDKKQDKNDSIQFNENEVKKKSQSNVCLRSSSLLFSFCRTHIIYFSCHPLRRTWLLNREKRMKTKTEERRKKHF